MHNKLNTILVKRTGHFNYNSKNLENHSLMNISIFSIQRLWEITFVQNQWSKKSFEMFTKNM